MNEEYNDFLSSLKWLQGFSLKELINSLIIDSHGGFNKSEFWGLNDETWFEIYTFEQKNIKLEKNLIKSKKS